MTELHDLDKSLLLSIITQRYPMVDVEIADMILQTAHSMDSLVSNIKFMCDIEMDEKKIIMDYDQQSERDLDSPKPSENSPKSSKSNSRSRKSSKSSSPTISNAVPHASSDTGSLTALDDKSPKLDQNHLNTNHILELQVLHKALHLDHLIMIQFRLRPRDYLCRLLQPKVKALKSLKSRVPRRFTITAAEALVPHRIRD